MEENKIGLKPLMLTKKVCICVYNVYGCVQSDMALQETKKMRKQRRQAERQDKRDRIRMGLIPPDPPKGTPQLL
jgi:U4/U6 small nuclear ribonucleoprotein PRP3